MLAFDTAGLGDRTYVVVLEDTAVVIDPQRDFDRFLVAADQRRATVRAVLETHVHNDYVSGAPGLAATTGAELVLPAGAGAAFRRGTRPRQSPVKSRDRGRGPGPPRSSA